MHYIGSKALEIFNLMLIFVCKIKHEIVQLTSVYTGSRTLKIFNSLYWLNGPVFYTGSEAVGFILAQRPKVLYWLNGPEINSLLYTGSKALIRFAN